MRNKLNYLHHSIIPEQGVEIVGERFNGRFSVKIANTIIWSNEPTKWPTTFWGVVDNNPFSNTNDYY